MSKSTKPEADPVASALPADTAAAAAPKAPRANTKNQRLLDMLTTAAWPKAPRASTKNQRLLDLLTTGTGSSLEEMIEATGWQSHTVRAAMTGLRKRGYEVERHIEGTTTMWSVKGGAK